MRRFYTFVTLCRDFPYLYLRGKEKNDQTSAMSIEAAISHWLAVFGAHGIMAVGKDMGDIGGIFQEFRTARNVVSKAVISANRQSLGPQYVDSDISEWS